jgi:hypothetical protein
MRGCNSVLFLECRKRQDAYMWISKTNFGTDESSGPSAKFLIENIHTMDELRLTGNCMKGSRPILTFDTAFDQREELKLLKCLFTDVFGTPRGHPKCKPFVDRVMGFYYADGKVGSIICDILDPTTMITVLIMDSEFFHEDKLSIFYRLRWYELSQNIITISSCR